MPFLFQIHDNSRPQAQGVRPSNALLRYGLVIALSEGQTAIRRARNARVFRGQPKEQSRDRQSMIGAQKYLDVGCVWPAPALMRGWRRQEPLIQALMDPTMTGQ